MDSVNPCPGFSCGSEVEAVVTWFSSFNDVAASIGVVVIENVSK